MIGLLLAGLALSTDVHYVDASLDLDGVLLDHRFADFDGDGALELCLALRLADGTRELRIHEIEATRIAPTPMRTIPVLEDVLAYSHGDVRDEAGEELVLLTKTGAWSWSTQHEGMRDNIRRLVEMELIYDVPDPRALPFWSYVLDGAPRPTILLPGRDGFTVFGPAPGPLPEDSRQPTYHALAEFDDELRQRRNAMEAEQAGTHVSIGTGGIDVRTIHDLDISFFLGDEGGRSDLLTRDRLSYRAPALADVDGDGRRDLVLWAKDGMRVHLRRDTAIGAEPDRIETLPEYLQKNDEGTELQLVDLNGDRRADLLAQVTENSDGLENSETSLLFLINDGTRLMPAKPDQVMRFEAAMLETNLLDVDGDGRRDLVVGKFEMPDLVETVTGFEFRLTHLVFFADDEGGGLFARRPGLKHEQVFDEETVGAAIANRHLEMDCDGDGIPDLVEVDLSGRIAIRRLTFESSFFGGDRWELETNPWKRFDTRGGIDSLLVTDLNGDGLGDVVSAGARTLTVLLSRKGGSR